MNWDQIEGSWNEFKGKVKQRWGKLSDNDLTAIGGKKDELVGRLQKHYGYAKERAEEEVKQFSNSCESDAAKEGPSCRIH